MANRPSRIPSPIGWVLGWPLGFEHRSGAMKARYFLVALILLLLVAASLVRGLHRSAADAPPAGTVWFTVGRGAFARTLRLTGLIESTRFHNVAAPRLVGATGPGNNTLVITRLAPSGTHVEVGQVLVEFDRQNQLKAAVDKRTELRDLEEQIRKKRAEQEQG